MVQLRKKKTRSGRPPLPADKVRANRLVTFVTDCELSELLRLADLEDMSMSAMCHHLIKESLHKKQLDEERPVIRPTP